MNYKRVIFLGRPVSGPDSPKILNKREKDGSDNLQQVNNGESDSSHKRVTFRALKPLNLLDTFSR